MPISDQLFERLKALRGCSTIIVGIGNELKGDDGAGSLICQRLKGHVTAEVIDCGTVPENYIQSIIKKFPANLVIIDAVHFGAAPGALEVIAPEQLDSRIGSTHTLAPRLFVEMVEAQIKVKTLFIGIQPGQVRLGEGLSEPVRKTADELVHALCEIFGK